MSEQPLGEDRTGRRDGALDVGALRLRVSLGLLPTRRARSRRPQGRCGTCPATAAPGKDTFRATGDKVRAPCASSSAGVLLRAARGWPARERARLRSAQPAVDLLPHARLATSLADPLSHGLAGDRAQSLYYDAASPARAHSSAQIDAPGPSYCVVGDPPTSETSGANGLRVSRESPRRASIPSWPGDPAMRCSRGSFAPRAGRRTPAACWPRARSCALPGRRDSGWLLELDRGRCTRAAADGDRRGARRGLLRAEPSPAEIGRLPALEQALLKLFSRYRCPCARHRELLAEARESPPAGALQPRGERDRRRHARAPSARAPPARER